MTTYRVLFDLKGFGFSAKNIEAPSPEEAIAIAKKPIVDKGWEIRSIDVETVEHHASRVEHGIRFPDAEETNE